MSTVYVQFTDDKNKTVGAVFSSPQDKIDHPNYEEIDSEDERYKSFMSSSVKPLSFQS
ncbi:Uncharacterised protein [Yersinia frederiksenii]|nr:Uncharacterised protein [Yersinia frederiksenii]CNI51376.1 Uncharacterised protein [Yersinia frederiksenii]HDL7738221.1 hypothetical protein [Yersinia enterocolitica]